MNLDPISYITIMSRTSTLSGPPFLHSHHLHPSHHKRTSSRRGTDQANARTTEARETLCSLLQLNCLLILWSLTSATWTWLDAPGNCIRTSWAPAEINNYMCANTPWKSHFYLGGMGEQIQLCHLLYHAALLKPWFIVFYSEHSGHMLVI